MNKTLGFGNDFKKLLRNNYSSVGTRGQIRLTWSLCGRKLLKRVKPYKPTR